jgi:anti-sigma factor RsiW
VEPRVTHEELMRFLDGELSPDEHVRVERALAEDSELARELAIFRGMKGQFQELSFDPGHRRRSVWGEVNRQLTQPIGWILLTGGVAVWTLYGAYLFATGPTDPWEKLATGAVVIGVLLLLASVIWERYREYLTDPYRDIQR